MKPILLVLSHGAVAFLGFAAGIYLLPILAEPPPPSESQMQMAEEQSAFQGTFRRDLPGSDSLHWGEGTVFVGARSISLRGELSPGPAYRLYLSPEFVDTEAAFLAAKSRMAPVADVRTFRNFLVPVPAGVEPAGYDTVVIWCEAFGQFITAAKYR